MDLKEFIVSAVTDIAEAVREADKTIEASGGLVNPGKHTIVGRGDKRRSEFVAPRSTLKFDIAVSASNTSGKAGGGKAKIWVVEASIDGKKEIHNETVSRLTFSLDVVLPHDPEQRNRHYLIETSGH